MAPLFAFDDQSGKRVVGVWASSGSAMQSGDYANYRLGLRQFGVNECNGDFSPIMACEKYTSYRFLF
jgi:hypothetical protein